METLGGCAHVAAGYPFRGTVPEVKSGAFAVVQMRDVDPATGVRWKEVARTNLPGRRQPDVLAPGDIVFTSRGQRNFAVCIDDVPMPAVCSQYFYLVRISDTQKLLPPFLAWLLNRAPAQNYFKTHAEGSDQQSIRRAVLEQLPIVVPPLDQQHRIIELHRDALSERQILEQLIRNREQQLDVIASELFTQPSSSKHSR